jgi:hypothetical protein
MHVTMLKEKWTKLMAEVPDIQIRVAAGLSARSLSQLSVDSSTDAGGYTSAHSLSSTRNPTGSQIIVNPIVEIDSAHASRILSPTDCTVDARSPLGMGFYHRSRTRPSTRPASHRHPSQFRPELACPNQIFPDAPIAAVQIARPPSDPPAFDVARVDGLLANLEYWRRLWANRSAPLHASRSFDLEASQADVDVAMPKVAFDQPTFASADCKVVRERETKRLLGLLLAHEGFQAVKADALTLLMDLFLDRFASLAVGLNKAFAGDHQQKSPLLLIRQSLRLDGSRDLARYTETFLAHRRRCLERACEAVQVARRELRAAAASIEEEVDVEAVDDQQDVLGDDDDLLDVDDEALLLGEDELPLPPANDSDSPPSTINLAAISTTAVVASAISASDILLVPKRSLQIPLQQQPPPKRPHQQED